MLADQRWALCWQVAELWDASIENTIRKLAYGTILGALGGLFLFRAPLQHLQRHLPPAQHTCSRPPRARERRRRVGARAVCARAVGASLR